MYTRRDDAPNIVLIMADQLRYDYVGSYQANAFIQTPNIDSLAQDGCLFENAYSPNPVCIPARHNMLTGLTARHHGFDDNYFGPRAKPCPYSLPTFAQILSDCGYATAAFGKMHFQPERRATGFDIFENSDEVVEDIQEDDYAQFLQKAGYGDIGSMHGVRNVLYMQPQQSFLPEELHGSKWVADRSIAYLQKRGDPKRPFMMCVGFIHPHPPFDVPPSFAHLYDGKIPPHTISKTPLSTLAEENKCIANLPDEENINRMRELYACAVTHMDSQVGRVLAAIDEYGYRENTLVIFLSDHGEMLGDLETYQKFLPYDASCKIPMVARWPKKLKAGEIRKDFVDLNDILPTMVDVAGTQYPAEFELPGESLFAETPKKDRSVQYAEHQRDSKRWCMLRDKRHKYIYHYGDAEQLFDLEQDPHEQINLLYQCHDATIYKVRDGLRRKLLDYEQRYGLQGGVQNGDFEKRPTYIPRQYAEGNYPSFMIQFANDQPLKPISEEIIMAIADEPTVKISKLGIAERLQTDKQCTPAQIDALVAHAKKLNRY